MPAKRQIKLNKKAKEVKEADATTTPGEIEMPIVEEETPVSTVIENEINDMAEVEVKENVVEKKKTSEKIIWTVGDAVVAKPKGRIAFEAQVAPVPMFKIPADIRQYLINKGFSTDVYKKDKEWLEKHWADMEMINRLKEFLISMSK